MKKVVMIYSIIIIFFFDNFGQFSAYNFVHCVHNFTDEKGLSAEWSKKVCYFYQITVASEPTG